MSSGPDFDGRLYLIVGPDHVDGDPVPLVRTVAAHGVTAVQLRDKRSGTRDMIDTARRLVAALEGTGVPLIVNDRVDVAIAASAAGVHLGAADMAPEDARRLLGPDPILGVTIKTEMQAGAIDPGIVDYASIGGVFETGSKRNPDPPIGLDGLRRLREVIRTLAPDMPVTAIAGIDEARAAPVVAAGADGIAVISAITAAENPAAAAALMRGIVDAALRERKAA